MKPETLLNFNGITEKIPLNCINDLKKLGFNIIKTENGYEWRQ